MLLFFFVAGGRSQLQQVFLQRARQRRVLFERHRQRFQDDRRCQKQIVTGDTSKRS